MLLANDPSVSFAHSLPKSKPSEAGLIWRRKKEPTDMELGAKAASGMQSASSDTADSSLREGAKGGLQGAAVFFGVSEKLFFKDHIFVIKLIRHRTVSPYVYTGKT